MSYIVTVMYHVDPLDDTLTLLNSVPLGLQPLCLHLKSVWDLDCWSGILCRTTARAEIHARSTALPRGISSVYRYICKLKFQRPEVCPSLPVSQSFPFARGNSLDLTIMGKGRGGSRPGNRSNRSNRSDRSRASPSRSPESLAQRNS